MSEFIRTPQRWLEQHVLLWQRWLVVGAVVLLTPLVAYVAPAQRLPLVLVLLVALFAGVIGIQFLRQRSALGVVLLIPANMVVPLALGPGSSASRLHAGILLTGLLVGLWIYEWLAGAGRIPGETSPFAVLRPVRPLLLLLVVAVLAFFAGQLPWFNTMPAPLQAQLGGLGVFLFSIAAFLLAAYRIRSLQYIEWMTWLMIALGTVYLVFRLVPGMFRYAGYIFPWGSMSSQFWNWFIALTFGQILFNRRLSEPKRLVLALILIAGVYSALVQTGDWKSGWLPPLVALVTIAALHSWQLAVGVGTIGLLAVPGLASQLVASDEYSYSTRLDAWMILLDIIKVNPILGLGPANYYFYTPLFSIRGYSVSFNSHNQYIDMILQTGILGLLCLLWFFGEMVRLGWQLRTRVPEGFARGYVYGALGGLVGTIASGMLGDWFLPFVYNVAIVGMRSSLLGWLFLGALVALDQMVRNGVLAVEVEGE